MGDYFRIAAGEVGKQLASLLLPGAGRPRSFGGKLSTGGEQLLDLVRVDRLFFPQLRHAVLGRLGNFHPHFHELGRLVFVGPGLVYHRIGLVHNFLVHLLRQPGVQGELNRLHPELVEFIRRIGIRKQVGREIPDGFLVLAELLVAAGLVQAGIQPRHADAVKLVNLLVTVGSVRERLRLLGTLGMGFSQFLGRGGDEQPGHQEVQPQAFPLFILLGIGFFRDGSRIRLYLLCQLIDEFFKNDLGFGVQDAGFDIELRLLGPHLFLGLLHFQPCPLDEQVAELAAGGIDERASPLLGDKLVQHLLSVIEPFFSDDDVPLVLGPLHQGQPPFILQRLLERHRHVLIPFDGVEIVHRHVVVAASAEGIQKLAGGLHGPSLRQPSTGGGQKEREYEPAGGEASHVWFPYGTTAWRKPRRCNKHCMYVRL